MVFYLLPPTGNVPYQKLEDYAVKRLQFLLRLVCCQSPEEVQETLQDASVVHQSDCLISGSSKDRISHHMLRLALCEDRDTRSFFCSSELALFQLWLAEMSVPEWEHFLEKTDHDLSQILRMRSSAADSFLSDLDFLFGILKQECGSLSQASREICEKPMERSLHLPFHLALAPIARREVDLIKGLAVIPMPMMPGVLCELFQRSMEVAINQARAQRVVTRQDPRIRRLCAVLKRVYNLETKASRSQLLSSSVPPLKLSTLWSKAECFPPCMSNLMNRLKQRHRLRHHDRIQLTLFLKDLGLSLHEALLLWKHEYSKPPGPPVDAGKRGWHGNERRYIYNIRHLYGLEGGRVDYRGHSCASIQSRSLSYLECGGCPFISLEEPQMSETLCQQGLDEPAGTLLSDLARQKRPGLACAMFVRAKVNQKHSRVCSRNPDGSAPTDKAHAVDGVKDFCDTARDVFCEPVSPIHPASANSALANTINHNKTALGTPQKNLQPCTVTQKSRAGAAINQKSKRTLRRLFKKRSMKSVNTESLKEIYLSEQSSSVSLRNNSIRYYPGNEKVDAPSKVYVVNRENCLDVIRKPEDYYKSYMALLDNWKSSV